MTQYNGVTIPPAQNLPPAGFNHIAFRPMCVQLDYVGYEDGTTAWNLQMPDGKIETLNTLPSNWSVAQAHENLNSAGLCKLGSESDGLVKVPIVYTSQIPKQSIPELAAEIVDQQALPDSQFTRFPVESVMGGLLLVVGLGLVAHSMMGRKTQPNTQASKADDLLKEIFANAD